MDSLGDLMAKRRSLGRSNKNFDYDVCLSFAGDDRAYVRRVADELRQHGVRVFYDEYAQADMWGKDLFIHFDDVYQNAARFCVLFASKHYASRVWTNHERESAQARAIREHHEYILPARLDSTRIPGLRPTVGYVDALKLSPKKVASLIVAKIGQRPKERYFPPVPDRLFTQARARTDRAREKVEARARDFFGVLQRMRLDERKLVFATFLNSCSAELPENVHATIDLLRRVTRFSEDKIVRLAGGMRSLGLFARLCEEHEHDEYLGRSKTLVLEWHDMATDTNIGGNGTGTAFDMLTLIAESGSYCADCVMPTLQRLDFSNLATATSQPHSRSTPPNSAMELSVRGLSGASRSSSRSR